MMLSSIHHTSLSDASGNFILGETGYISSFDSAARISPASWLWFSDVLYLPWLSAAPETLSEKDNRLFFYGLSLSFWI